MAKMLETAKSILGYDLLEVCQEGPKEKLDNTVYSQVVNATPRRILSHPLGAGPLATCGGSTTPVVGATLGQCAGW